MEKNISALLREDARTVHVSFDLTMADFDDMNVDIDRLSTKPAGAPKGYRSSNGGPQLYTYVSHLPLKPRDTVVVTAKGTPTLATVVRMDDEVDIEPNSTIRYAWVIGKVDMAAHEQNEARNRELERTVADAYRTNMRRSFAQAVLGAVDPDKRLALENLLKGPAA